ncbi:uncharacterized protein VTP21DRAFT_1611 [Calcarisporiella thermophila]|uniref:uncharacterized protein n=1 Tax=Calcarisporiella thermophila TaxID=911321 RepID=UPI0037433995
MTSSLRNVVHRRNHKERAQPLSRQRLGLLEKHKDYVLRARDYHSKQKRITALRQKAAMRNPDEFYFKMIGTKTKGGVHVVERNKNLSHDVVQLLKTQDHRYIRMQRDISKKKIEKLKTSLHFIEGEDIQIHDGDEDALAEQQGESSSSQRPKHTIFVDSEAEVAKFDPVKHFETAPEFINRNFNRPRLSNGKQAAVMSGDSDNTTLKMLQKGREEKRRELESRLAREEKLAELERELIVQRCLAGKGAKKKVGVDKNGNPVWKWRAQRKK